MAERMTGVLCTAVAALLLVSSVAFADSAGLRIVYTDWFPYTFEQNGQAAGFEIDITRAVFQQMGIPVKFTPYPWNRCLGDLKKGRADALVSLLKTPDREVYTYFPDTAISLSKTVFFTVAGRDIPFDGSYGGLSRYRIGVIMGFSYGEAFDNAAYLTKDPAYHVEMLITKLLAGRTDLAAENQAVVSASAGKLGLKSALRFLDPPIHTQKLYVGFSRARGLKTVSEDFSRALEAFKATREYRNIIESYGVDFSDILE